MLARLVEVELLYQRGQQSHQRLAQVLEEQFSYLAATPPEPLAYHYTEAGLNIMPAPGNCGMLCSEVS